MKDRQTETENEGCKDTEKLTHLSSSVPLEVRNQGFIFSPWIPGDLSVNLVDVTFCFL